MSSQTTIILTTSIVVLIVGCFLIIYSLCFSKNPIFVVKGWRIHRYHFSEEYKKEDFTPESTGENCRNTKSQQPEIVDENTIEINYGYQSDGGEENIYPEICSSKMTEIQIENFPPPPQLQTQNQNQVHLESIYKTPIPIRIQRSTSNVSEAQNEAMKKALETPTSPRIYRDTDNSQLSDHSFLSPNSMQSYDKSVQSMTSNQIPNINPQRKILKKSSTITSQQDRHVRFRESVRPNRIERAVTISVCQQVPSAPTLEDLYLKPYAPTRKKYGRDRRRRTITVE